jgi:hypothetical protein
MEKRFETLTERLKLSQVGMQRVMEQTVTNEVSLLSVFSGLLSV